MSIATEIARIEEARDAIAAAIRQKGVTVAEGAVLSSLAGKIAELTVSLPSLGADAASAGDIRSGKKAYGADGSVITGTWNGLRTGESSDSSVRLIYEYNDEDKELTIIQVPPVNVD